jgi:hypothetical protein
MQPISLYGQLVALKKQPSSGASVGGNWYCYATNRDVIKPTKLRILHWASKKVQSQWNMF